MDKQVAFFEPVEPHNPAPEAEFCKSNIIA
jgi:hypothetical protein